MLCSRFFRFIVLLSVTYQSLGANHHITYNHVNVNWEISNSHLEILLTFAADFGPSLLHQVEVY